MGLLDFDAMRKFFGLDAKLQIRSPFPETAGTSVDPSTANPWWAFYQHQMKRSKDRMSRYREFEKMDEWGLCIAVLDLYMEDATQHDSETGRAIWTESQSADVVRHLHGLFDRTGMQTIVGPICRKMIKYGDNFEGPAVRMDTNEIINLRSPHPAFLERLEQHGMLIGYDKGPGTLASNTGSASPDSPMKMRKDAPPKYKPWEFIHFRMPSRDRDWLYGDSIMFPLVDVWKQLKMILDSMVVYRMSKFPDRYVYYIDVGTATPEEAYDIVNRWKRSIKKRTHLDISNNLFKAQFRPEGVDADVFWPTREGSQSRVDRLPGAGNVQHIADVDILTNQFFGLSRIPKGFLGFEEPQGGLFTNESYLSTQSVRFASTLKHVRRALIDGMRTLCSIQLVYAGLDPRADRYAYTLGMAPINYLDELQRSKIAQTRMDMASTAVRLGEEMRGQPGMGNPDDEPFPFNRVAWVTWVMVKLMKMPAALVDSVLQGQADKSLQGPSGLNASEERKLYSLVENCEGSVKAMVETIIMNAEMKKESWDETPSPDEINTVTSLMEHRV